MICWCGIIHCLRPLNLGLVMKTILLATAFLFAVAGSAFAVDAVVSEPTPEPAPAVFVWTGAYVGGQVGYAWADSHYSEPEFPGYVADYDPDGSFGGIYAGYSHQFSNRLVVGAEVDVALSYVTSDDAIYYGAGEPWGSTLAADLKWSGALRARVGYAFDRFMPYAAGGLAVAKYDYSVSDGGDGFDASATLTGWTVGGGFEYAAADNVLIRAEYRFSDFGSNRVNEDDTVAWYTNDVDLSTHDIRLGVAYKF